MTACTGTPVPHEVTNTLDSMCLTIWVRSAQRLLGDCDSRERVVARHKVFSSAYLLLNGGPHATEDKARVGENVVVFLQAILIVVV